MQGPSRRQVCAGTALAGISWTLGACDRAPAIGDGLPEPTRGEAPPGLADFGGIVGSNLSVNVNGAPRSLRLTALRDHGAPIRKPRPRGEAFTLILDGTPADPAIASATYSAQHPALGSFTLFLVSHLAPGQDRPRYSATFSRI